jgi:hypothetical protein
LTLEGLMLSLGHVVMLAWEYGGPTVLSASVRAAPAQSWTSSCNENTWNPPASRTQLEDLVGYDSDPKKRSRQHLRV